MAGRRRRLEFEHNLAMRAAWHTARLARVQRFPPLKKMLIGEAVTRRQSWQEQLKVMEAWRAKTAHLLPRKKR